MGRRIVSTVTTPATSYDLTTLTNLKLALGEPADDTDLDAYFTDRISRVSAAIARHCNNPFVVETITDEIYIDTGPYPWQVPGRAHMLQLSRWPIVAITSVEVLRVLGQTCALTQGTDYLLKADVGQLVRLDKFTGYAAPWDAEPVTVVYQAGYATVPLDVEDACQRMVAKAFWARGRDPTLMQQDQGSLGSQRFWISNGADGNMPPEIADLLDAYRTPVIA